MRSLTQAQKDVLDVMPRTESERVSVAEAKGRVLAQAAVSRTLVPPFPNSAMDGFAVISADIDGSTVSLPVIEDVPAGTVPTRTVESGSVTRIMTGAPMPEGADAVVPIEDTESTNRSMVSFTKAIEPGVNVRPAGGDVQPGDVVVEAGVRLGARHVASLASVGISPVVSKMPVVALMSTGDEIVEPDTELLGKGKIRDTNRILLRGVIENLGLPYVDMGIIGDDVDELRSAYTRAAEVGDVIISTGGVSMGDFDFVKQILRDTGSVDFWRVAMQPGKPFAFGDVSGVPLFGLPGNPVSTFVSFEQLVRPALLHMMGATKIFRQRVPGIMGEDVHTTDQRDVFLRVMLAESEEATFVAIRSGGQSSNVLSALAMADAFAIVPQGVSDLSAGDPVELEMFTWDERRTFDG